MKKYFVLITLVLFVYNIYSQQSSADTIGKTTRTPIQVPFHALNFIAMGDWGRNGEDNQKEVAIQMGITAKEADAYFIVATGDNFYPSGVRSTQDYSWIASYENMYTAHSLQTDWYVVLGNHDYKGNVQAEIDYSKISRRWNMPSRYFAKKINIEEDTTRQILMVFLDTSPFITQYYTSEDHRNQIVGQDTTAQKKWLEAVLSDPSPNIKWRIVVGHHPLYTGGKRMFSLDTWQLNKALKSIFDKYKVDAYICGHEHNLQYIKPEGATHYFVTGAGSETTPAILYPGIGKFAQSINGFMLFSVEPKQMQVQIIDLNGNVLDKEVIRK
jgi:tartrate-resistant acid phosphatase type 5